MNTPDSSSFDFAAYDALYRREQRLRLEELTLTGLALSASLEDRVAILHAEAADLAKDVAARY